MPEGLGARRVLTQRALETGLVRSERSAANGRREDLGCVDHRRVRRDRVDLGRRRFDRDDAGLCGDVDDLGAAPAQLIHDAGAGVAQPELDEEITVGTSQQAPDMGCQA
mgnify:CR=1 FL=1